MSADNDKLVICKISATMRAQEVAKYLGLGVNQVYEAAARGDIPARKVGRRWLFFRQAIVAWSGGNKCEMPEGT